MCSLIYTSLGRETSYIQKCIKLYESDIKDRKSLLTGTVHVNNLFQININIGCNKIPQWGRAMSKPNRYEFIVDTLNQPYCSNQLGRSPQGADQICGLCVLVLNQSVDICQPDDCLVHETLSSNTNMTQ